MLIISEFINFSRKNIEKTDHKNTVIPIDMNEAQYRLVWYELSLLELLRWAIFTSFAFQIVNRIC